MNTEHRTQKTDKRIQNREHRNQIEEYRTQNTKNRLQNKEH